MSQVLAQIAKAFIREGAKATSLLSQRAGSLKDLVKPLVEAGQTAGLNDAGHAQSVCEALRGFKGSLNGQALPDTHSFLDGLLAKLNGGKNLEADEAKSLLDLAEQVSNLPVENPPVAELQAKLEAAEQKATNTEEEIDKRVREKLDQAGLTNDGMPKHWADKVLKGVSGIIVSEVKNLNSPIGWAIQVYGKFTGKEFNRESVNKFLGRFLDNGFKGRLEKLVEAKILKNDVPESVFEGLSENEKTGLQWVGRLAHWGSKTPKWVFDSIAGTGVIIDASAEMLHHIPILGSILKIPLVRMTYTNLAAFFGRFSQDIDLISKGAKQLKDIVKPAAETASK